MKYVECPAKITAPVSIYPNFPLPPNTPCLGSAPIIKEADVMECRCPYGHTFFATPADIKETD